MFPVFMIEMYSKAAFWAVLSSLSNFAFRINLNPSLLKYTSLAGAAI